MTLDEIASRLRDAITSHAYGATSPSELISSMLACANALTAQHGMTREECLKFYDSSTTSIYAQFLEGTHTDVIH
jgi:hypothetical protein